MGDHRKTLSRLATLTTLSRSAGEGYDAFNSKLLSRTAGEGDQALRAWWVRVRHLSVSSNHRPFGGSARRLAIAFALCEHDDVEIVIARGAGKVLARMQPAKAKDIREAIDKVAADPTAPNNNLRALKGVPNGFRIRVGDWRVSYTLDYQAGVMSVFEIAPRGGAYR